MKRTDRDSGLAFELDEKSPVSYADQLVAASRSSRGSRVHILY